MKVLVTGFDPFGGEVDSPAYEAIKLLPDTIAGAEIIKLEIPTVFARSTLAVEKALQAYEPDLVICVGQAGGNSCITIEKIAVNLAQAGIPDNDGELKVDDPLQEDGDIAYYSNLPINAIVKNIRDHDIPCYISYSAGTYVCNCVMYNVLYMTSRKYPNIRSGFIHVPYSSAQAVNKPNGTPFMSLTDIAKSLEYAIEASVTHEKDIPAPMQGIIE